MKKQNNFDYSKITDEKLLNITNIFLNKGGIPIAAVKEAKKRKLDKYGAKIITSNDFDKNGNFIN